MRRQAVSGKIQKHKENDNEQVLQFHYDPEHIFIR